MNIKRALAHLAVGAALVAGGADAHARLMAANPAVNATTAAPGQIVLTFTERLQPQFSRFELTRGGVRIAIRSSVGRDRRTLVGIPARPLASGRYQVAWRAVTSDAHRMQGTYSFVVR